MTKVELNKIRILPGTYPRSGVSLERIQLFCDLFEAKKNIPPIHVVPLVDKKNTVAWALIDGRHRLEAKRLLSEEGSGKSHIAITYEKGFTISVDKATEVPVLKEVLLMATKANLKHGLPISLEDRRRLVKELYSRFGYSVKALVAIGFGSKTSIYRWLEDVNEKLRRQKETGIREGLEEGGSIKSIAKRLGLSRQRVRRVAKVSGNGKKGGSNSRNGKMYHPEKSSQCMEKSHEDRDERLYPEIGSDEQKILHGIHQGILDLAYTQSAEAYLKFTVFPLCADKFPGLAEVIKGHGYAYELESLQIAYFDLKDKLREVSELSLQRLDEVTRLNDELDKRSGNCENDCPHTIEKLTKMHNNNLMSLVENFFLILDVHCDVDSKKTKALLINKGWQICSHSEWGVHHGVLMGKLLFSLDLVIEVFDCGEREDKKLTANAKRIRSFIEKGVHSATGVLCDD